MGPPTGARPLERARRRTTIIPRAGRRPQFLALVLAAACLAGTARAVSVHDIALSDQFGNVDSLGAHAGELVVVMVVTARGLLNIKSWEADLRQAVDGVTYLRVADIPEDPPVTYERVAGKLRLVVLERVPVLVDMERQWARALDLDTDVPNVLLFTRDGNLAARYRGRWHPDNVAEVAARLHQLLAAR